MQKGKGREERKEEEEKLQELGYDELMQTLMRHMNERNTAICREVCEEAVVVKMGA